MAKAKNGNTVKVHYTGRLDDGTVFDSSEMVEESGGCCSSGCGSSGCGGSSAEPLEFVVGEGQVIPGFESAVIGLAVGEQVTVHIKAEDAYGPYYDHMVAVVNRAEMSNEIVPIEGQHLEVLLQDGSSMPVLITAVTDDTVTLDANHPMAGKNLNFDIRLVEIAG